MRGKTFGLFVQKTSWSFAVTLILIAAAAPVRVFANEPLPPTEERQHTEQDRCKFLMAKAAQQLRDISEALQGRSWLQRKKLKEITARIEAISEELERPWRDSKPGGNDSVGSSAIKRRWHDGPPGAD